MDNPLATNQKPASTTMVYQLLPKCVHVCSGLPIVCSAARQKRRTSCRTFGCGGRLQIEVSLRTRGRSWRRQRHEFVSILLRAPNRAERPISGPGFPNLYDTVAIPHWARSVAKH